METSIIQYGFMEEVMLDFKKYNFLYTGWSVSGFLTSQSVKRKSLKPFNLILAQRPKKILLLQGTILSKTCCLYVHIKYFTTISGVGRQSELQLSCLPTSKMNSVVM